MHWLASVRKDGLSRFSYINTEMEVYAPFMFAYVGLPKGIAERRWAIPLLVSHFISYCLPSAAKSVVAIFSFCVYSFALAGFNAERWAIPHLAPCIPKTMHDAERMTI